MIADILLVILALVGLTISAIVDIKTSEIPNWTNFSMVAVALAIRLMHSVSTLEWTYFLYGLAGFGIMLVVGNIMYYTKQWGGGDSKLLFAIGAIFATRPYFVKEFPVPFLLVMFLAIILTGAIYSFIYGVTLAALNYRKFYKELLDMNKQYRNIRNKVVIISLLIAIMGLFFPAELGLSIIGLAAVTIISTFWILFAKSIEGACLVKNIPLSKLTEGDWISDEKIRKKFKISSLGIDKSQIQKMRKSKLKKVEVKYGIPFAPAFLIALIIVLIL